LENFKKQGMSAEEAQIASKNAMSRELQEDIIKNREDELEKKHREEIERMKREF
jgi:hypothetical protein